MAYVPYARQAGIVSIEGVIQGAGGLLGGYLKQKLKESSFYAKYFEKNFKEWAGFVAGIALGAVWKLLERQGLVRQGMLQVQGISLEDLITGTIAALSAETGRVLAGDTEIFSLGSFKVKAKNIDTVTKVVVDGNDVTNSATVNGDEITLPSNVGEGVHDVVIIGTAKAAYNKIYVLA